MPARVAHHAFGLTGRAGGVEDIGRVGGLYGGAVGRFACVLRGADQVRVVVVAARDEVTGLPLALQDQAGLRLALGQVNRRIELA